MAQKKSVVPRKYNFAMSSDTTEPEQPATRVFCSFSIRRSKSRIQKGGEPGLQPTVRMDYSDIHKENDELDRDLQNDIVVINKTAERKLAEKGEELQVIRKQMEEIVKYKEAVSSSRQNGSGDVVANARATRYGRRATQDDLGGQDKSELNIRELVKASRAQTRLDIEREKFSSKNLFNVRRSNAGLGSSDAKKTYAHASLQLIQQQQQNQQQFKDLIKNATGFYISEDEDDDKEDSVGGGSGNGNMGYAKHAKGPQMAHRPTTAMPPQGRKIVSKPDDILPPRSQSAAIRSRSRRELELLSRVMTGKDDEEDLAAVDAENAIEVVFERQRRKRLHQLKKDNNVLQSRVQTFISDIQKFNKKPFSISEIQL